MDVIKTYNETGSIRRTAKECGYSDQKIRKILLSAGINLESERTQEINTMSTAGMTISEISAKLKISKKAVNSHLPYRRGAYGGEDATDNAKKLRAWKLKRK